MCHHHCFCINMQQLFWVCWVFAAAATLLLVLLWDCCLDHDRQLGVCVGLWVQHGAVAYMLDFWC